MQAVKNLMIPDLALNSEVLLRTVELLSDGQEGYVSFEEIIIVNHANTDDNGITTIG